MPQNEMSKVMHQDRMIIQARADSESPDQTAHRRRSLIRAFAVRFCPYTQSNQAFIVRF